MQALIEKGLGVSLTLVGGDYEFDDGGYWNEVRESYLSRYPVSFHFPGYCPRDEIDSYLRTAHVYCSATLAEGCSLSRIRALTLGMPIVTTRCGALIEVAAGARNIRVCPPGDWKALSHELEMAVADRNESKRGADPGDVKRWREHFSVAREREEWAAAIEETLR